MQEAGPSRADLIRSKEAMDLSLREIVYVLEYYIPVKFEGRLISRICLSEIDGSMLQEFA